MKKYSTTKKEMFAQVIAVLKNSNVDNKSELIERIEHEISLCEKKSSSVNEAKKALDTTLKTEIMSTLSETGMTVTEIQLANEKLSLANGISNAKVSAMLKQLVSEGKAVKVIDKKKSYFALA